MNLNAPIFLVLYVTFIELILYSIVAAPPALGLDQIYREAADMHKIPEDLLRAVCYKESWHDPLAYNHGDGGGTIHAFGPCQVLSSTIKSTLKWEDPRCHKDFRDRSTRSADTCLLFDPTFTVRFAAYHLRQLLDKYQWNVKHALAAYNAGGVYTCKTGVIRRKKDQSIIATCPVGGVLNQYYIDDVLKYRKLRK